MRPRNITILIIEGPCSSLEHSIQANYSLQPIFSDIPMEKEEADPRMIVEELRANKFGIGVDGMKNPLARDMHESIRHLAAELYQKDIHFVMELVQVQNLLCLSQ